LFEERINKEIKTLAKNKDSDADMSDDAPRKSKKQIIQDESQEDEK